MMKSFSLAAMAVLVLVGCNSGGDNAQAATLADAKVIAENIGNSVSFGESLNSQGNNTIGTFNTKSRSVFSQACSNGGNMFIDFDQTQIVSGQEPTNMKMSMKMVNCVEGGTITNGKMVFDISNGDNIDMSFPTDFTVTENGQTMKVFAGGSIKTKEQAPYEVMTINMRMSDGTATYGGKNLVYKMKENSNGSVEIFPASGEENFGTGIYFKVDPNYNAGQTPMVSDYNGNLLAGGMFKYLDGVNHKVEVEATAVNEVTVRVDENGNGTFEENEIESITVE